MKRVQVKQCARCGQELESWGEYHTYESCLLFKLNDYRRDLGKPSIVVDIEQEDTGKKGGDDDTAI